MDILEDWAAIRKVMILNLSLICRFFENIFLSQSDAYILWQISEIKIKHQTRHFNIHSLILPVHVHVV